MIIDVSAVDQEMVRYSPSGSLRSCPVGQRPRRCGRRFCSPLSAARNRPQSRSILEQKRLGKLVCVAAINIGPVPRRLESVEGVTEQCRA